MNSPLDAAHWRELFDQLDDVLAWMKDHKGKYVWVNRAFLLNYILEHPGTDEATAGNQILGKTDYELSPAFLADQFRIDDEQVLAGTRILNRIERVGASESAALWHVTNKIPVTDEKNEIIGTAGTTRLQRSKAASGCGGPFGAVLAFMRDHYHEPITNQQLATMAAMSVRAFERHFLAGFHLTPQKYLRKLRLGMASRALIYSGETLAGVALACGFGDQSHFTREFRRHFGRTPGEYREHYRNEAGISGTNSAASRQSPRKRHALK